MHNRNQELKDLEDVLSRAINNLKQARDCYHDIRVDRIASGLAESHSFNAGEYIRSAKEILNGV